MTHIDIKVLLTIQYFMVSSNLTCFFPPFSILHVENRVICANWPLEATHDGENRCNRGRDILTLYGSVSKNIRSYNSNSTPPCFLLRMCLNPSQDNPDDINKVIFSNFGKFPPKPQKALHNCCHRLSRTELDV